MNPFNLQPVKFLSLIFINSTQIIRQMNPRITSGNHPIYKLIRSFTRSLISYERAAKKEYIILMRNFVCTQLFPDFHVIISIKKKMSIHVLSDMKTKVFANLAKWNVSGYYVFEPTLKRNGLHIHIVTKYFRSVDDLKLCIKIAFELAGLKYGTDFHFNVIPFTPTFRDFKRLCSYILKFNGSRQTNLRIPRLFIPGLRLRKTGSFGKWFVKTKGELWQEHKEECRIRREARQALSVQNPPQDVFDAFGDAHTPADLPAVSSALDREGFYIDSQDSNEDWQPWIDTLDIR
jgi:hypothetical protein